MNKLRIVMAQLNTLVGDVEGNVDKVIDAAIKARDEMGADLIAFPELTLTSYPPEDLLLRPSLHMHVLAGLERISMKVDGIGVLVGHPHSDSGGSYNAASLIHDGQILATYRKQHLPNYSVFDEVRYFVPGDCAAVVEFKGIKLGLTVCEDIWQPGPALMSKESGAQLILNINASPYHIEKGNERKAVVAERVHETGLPVLYVNQVGGQDELVFDGGSFVMNREGEVVNGAPLFDEGLYAADFTLGPDGVEALSGEIAAEVSGDESVYRALVLGVRDYVNKNGFPGVVIGLSGGIDSALTLAVAVDALGAERVEAVMMPSDYTASISLEDAQEEAQLLGVEYRVLPIKTIFHSFQALLAEEFAGTEPDVTEENLQARTRGVILMAIANKKHKMVLTTGNKSEVAVGYATLYGDMAGGFDVLKDVPKTLVYRLSRYRNTLSEVIPVRVIERPPSAELAPDQQDSDSLPDYDLLDGILERYIERDWAAEEIVADGYDETTVRRVIKMVDRNEYKRRQAAPGVRITRRAFGRDRRYPITSGYAYNW